MQERLETAIAAVADETVEVVCAGRTDTGVHATGQVVHFDTTATRTGRSWLLGVNSNLPDDVSVAWAQTVSDEFHARFSATARHYRYRILNRLQRSALHRRRAWWVHQPLDAAAMHRAAQQLVGEHDFSAFRAAGCQARNPVREIFAIGVDRDGDWVTLAVSANAFLQHMVRNLTGTLVRVGTGDASEDWVAAVLTGKTRTAAGVAAPPHGLTLVKVDYPDGFGLPQVAADYA